MWLGVRDDFRNWLIHAAEAEPREFLQAKCTDDRRKRCGLLLPTRVVKKEAGERRTPIFQHAYQRSTRELRCDTVFRHPGQTGPVDSGLNDEIQVIDEERAAHRNRHRLIAFIEFPPILALTSVTEADALMLQHISRRCRLGM